MYYISKFLKVIRVMVSWQFRLTPKQAAAKIVVAIVGLAIGAYGVATIYKPLQVSTYNSWNVWYCSQTSQFGSVIHSNRRLCCRFADII